MERSISTILVLVALGAAAWATCYPNSNPSQYSCCNPDTPTGQTRTTQDQKAQQAANTYCIGKCTNDTASCIFQLAATTGCLASGTYSNVWAATTSGERHQCNNGSYYYTYSYLGVDPVQQGETAKYVIDNMNCAPPG